MFGFDISDIEYLLDGEKMTMDAVPRFCHEAFNAGTFESEFPGRRSRQRLCEFLGIAESTLSGWLKEDRIPLMAKEAYVLFRAVEALSQEIERLKVEAGDFKILESDGHYQVCELNSSEDGEIIGKIVADNIPTIQDARMLASAKKMCRLLDTSRDVYTKVTSDTSNDEYRGQMHKEDEEIYNTLGYANDLEAWKEEVKKEASEAKKRGQELFDSL